MSLWSDVSRRYREERELRTAELGARFLAQFTQGVLELRLPNRVARRIDADEFRATWRLLDEGASAETLRLVTRNAKYLAAVRTDLVDSGSRRDDGGDDDIDPGTAEAILVEQAKSRSADERLPGSADPPTGEGSGIEHNLRQVTEERDGLARDLARLRAAIQGLEEQLGGEKQRATELEAALARERTNPRGSAVIGNSVDVTAALRQLIRQDLVEVPAEFRVALSGATDVFEQQPDLAVVQCRKVLEEAARQQWRSAFGADELPPYARFTDLMMQVKDQPGVDFKVWSLHRTLYTLANSSAHSFDAASPRMALLVVLGTVQIAVRVGK